MAALTNYKRKEVLVEYDHKYKWSPDGPECDLCGEDHRLSKIDMLLREVQARQGRGHPKAWWPFATEESALLRAYYVSVCEFPLEGRSGIIRVKATNQIIATMYNRVVIGDYGAYLEMEPGHMILTNIKQKWPGKPSRPVKYLWMVTTVPSDLKVYLQQGTVRYADYKVGMYYVAPRHVHSSASRR